MGILSDLKVIKKGLDVHTLTKDSNYRLTVKKRILWWQLRKSKFDMGMEIDWVDDRKLMVYPGRASSTGNFYYGLLEYEPMAFAFHYISPEDVFYDIGANVGVYSVIGKNAGMIFSFEPAEDTKKVLQKNLEINEMSNASIIGKGVSDKVGVMYFTNEKDCVNHIVTKADIEENLVSIEVTDLDSFVEEINICPTIIKIDAEGAEESIIEGADKVLSNERLKVVIMEIFDDESRSKLITDRGFTLCTYNPRTRELIPGSVEKAGGTGIYIRDIEQARNRVREGQTIVYKGTVLA